MLAVVMYLLYTGDVLFLRPFKGNCWSVSLDTITSVDNALLEPFKG